LSDAYYLGYWLGDGFTDNAGAIALGVEDEEWVLSRWPGGSLRRTSNAYLLPPESKQRKLILSLGLRGAKKLPEIVFSLGFEQRLSVLRGLMDSDGYAEGSRVEFTSTNRGLAYGVLRLARTLGQKPRLVEGRATIYGKDCGPKYRVYWRPAYGVNPFFLPRKANVISFGGKQESRNHHRMIVAWEEVEYEPTVCISVDHEDHLFLAGEALIPTHNTAVGANAVREHVHKFGYSAVGLIAATASDARDTMIDGKGGSSLLEISPPWEGLEYFPTKRKLSWKNGATGHSYSAEEPERLRGPQHDFIWMDELATWRYLQDTWDQASFGLRLGQNPKRIITTTPRPLPLLNEILKDAVPVEVYMADPDKYPGATVLVRGATMENADNLAPQFLEELKRKYEGTRLGRQEIYAEILDDNPNALFRQMKIDENRVEVESGSLRKGSDIKLKYRLSQGAERPQSFKTTLSEFVIAVDPSMSSDTSSDETGILVQAVDEKKSLYVVEDASGIMTPNEWAKRVLMLYQKYGADSIVAEVNQGGDLVENTIRTAEKEMDIGRVNYRKVRASKGKYARAEPVGALEEQGRIHHIGDFPKLEEQLTTFQPGYQSSPDRLDAYVWGAHHLIIQREKKGFFIF
jgi:phage terminase large subunit-like protein